jgi:predicted RNA binding protein YcfA (HicA-like mRNA interferase family)
MIGLRSQSAYQVRVKSREVIKKISAAGWYEVRAKGSHHQFKHATREGLVTVPHPECDLPKGTLRSIERQSGVKIV